MTFQRPLERTEFLSVGRLADATGISADTLRIWERRYGQPRPLRLPSGHRRYPVELVPWLRKIAAGLASGLRPSKLLGLSGEELDQALAGVEPDALRPAVAEWLELTAAPAPERLEASLEAVAAREPVLVFLDEYLAPFLRAVGRHWADGSLDVRHEHLASEIVEGVLRRLRARITARSGGAKRGTFLLANLPGELHGLGLQMVAAVCAELRIEVRLLGANTPLKEIALSAEETRPDAVAIGVSLAGAGVAADRLLATLRGLLPDDYPLLVGGEGARSGRRGPRGVRVFHSLGDFATWIREELQQRDASAAPASS